MININVLHGLRLQGRQNLRKVVITDEGRRLSHIDNWAALIDPDYCSPTEGTVCNRALREEQIPLYEGAITLGNFDNGPRAFNTNDNAGGGFIRVNPDVDVNPDAWTFFIVMEPQQNNTSIQRFVNPVDDGSTEGVCFNIGMNNQLTSIIVYENARLTGGQPQRLNYSVPSSRRGRRTLMMCTFSVREGLKFFWNGELVAENRDDRRPLTYGYRAGEWQMLRVLRGMLGMSGVLNIDMSEPDYEGDRLTLEKFMMEKYAITP